jgi:hypothetical protein
MEQLMLLDETVVACVPRKSHPAENPKFDEIEARYGNDPDLLVGALACCERALSVTNEEHRRLKTIHGRVRSALRVLRESYIAVLDEVMSLRRHNTELTQQLHAVSLKLEMAQAEIAQNDRDYARMVQRCEGFENRLAMLTEDVLRSMPPGEYHADEPDLPGPAGSSLPMERLFDATLKLSLVS